MTSKYGFSVVAPISVIEPLLDRRQERVLLRLVEAVDLVEEEDRPLPLRAEPLAGAGEHAADVRDRGRDRRELLERGAGRSRRRSARASSCRSRAGRRRSPSATRSSSIARRSAEPSPSTCSWPTNSSSVAGRSRMASGALSGSRCAGGVGEEVASSPRSMLSACRGRSRPGSRTSSRRSSPARARATTSATCAPTSCSRCRRPPEERAHHDELLFQTTHQSSELWLKLAGEEIEVGDRASRARARSRRRCACSAASILCFKLVTAAARHARADVAVGVHGRRPARARPRQRVRLARLEPRPARGARRSARRSTSCAARRACRCVDVYTQGREREDLYQLAEALTELDEWATTWRVRHFMVVERIIGGEVVGTQGTPVELLGKLVTRKLYPELWKVRTELTEPRDRGARTERPPTADAWGGGELRADRRGVRADARAASSSGWSRGPGERFLDLACGTGGVALIAARAGADVTGVDISPGAAREGAGGAPRPPGCRSASTRATPRRCRTTTRASTSSPPRSA